MKSRIFSLCCRAVVVASFFYGWWDKSLQLISDLIPHSDTFAQLTYVRPVTPAGRFIIFRYFFTIFAIFKNSPFNHSIYCPLLQSLLYVRPFHLQHGQHRQAENIFEVNVAGEVSQVFLYLMLFKSLNFINMNIYVL